MGAVSGGPDGGQGGGDACGGVLVVVGDGVVGVGVAGVGGSCGGGVSPVPGDYEIGRASCRERV